MRYLLLLILLGLAAWLLGLRSRGPSAPPAPPPSPPSPGPPAGSEVMLACVRCGLHLPRSEAWVDAAGRLYCSEAHRRAGPDGSS